MSRTTSIIIPSTDPTLRLPFFFTIKRVQGQSSRAVRRPVALIMTALIVLASASCSVKEDRGDCPCYLSVRTSSISSFASLMSPHNMGQHSPLPIDASLLHLRAWYGQTGLFQTSYSETDLSDIHEYMVPRGEVRLSAVYRVPRMTVTGTVMRIAKGHQMDSLYAYSAIVSTQCEATTVDVSLHKNFSTISFEFKEAPDDDKTGGLSPSGNNHGRIDGYDLEVVGSVDGVDIRTLEPVEGEFRCIPAESSSGGYAFRAPRQTDSSLRVDLILDGEVMDHVDLGTLIQKAGYDWKAEDLGDIHILADIPTHTFVITVTDWDDSTKMTVVI